MCRCCNAQQFTFQPPPTQTNLSGKYTSGSERERKKAVCHAINFVIEYKTWKRVSEAEKKVAENERREGFSAKLRDYRRHSKLLSRNETFHFNKLSLKPPSPRVQESKSNYQVNYFSFLFSFDCWRELSSGSERGRWRNLLWMSGWKLPIKVQQCDGLSVVGGGGNGGKSFIAREFNLSLL